MSDRIQALAHKLGLTDKEMQAKQVAFAAKYRKDAPQKLYEHLRGLWEQHRDHVRLLRSLPPVMVPNRHYSQRKIDASAEESAYTERPVGLVDDAGEAIDAITQAAYCKQADEDKETQFMVNQRRREQYEVAQRLKRAEADAYERGVDISSPKRVIERQLAKIERRVYEGKAA